MKRTYKRILCFLICISLILGQSNIYTVIAGATENIYDSEDIDIDENAVISGTDYGITWTIDDAGKLTASGTVSDNKFPWKDYKTDIKTAKITVSGYTDLSRMFENYENLESADLSGLDTEKVTNMTKMFYNCTKLKSINVSNFDTMEVTNMISMFEGCSELTDLDLSSFITPKVNSMASMFSGCTKLENLDVSHFITSKVTSMSFMFRNDKNLKNIDIHNFDTKSLTAVNCMFENCESLEKLDLSYADFGSVTLNTKFIEGCVKLAEIKTPKNMTNELPLYGQWLIDGTKTIITTLSPEHKNKTLLREIPIEDMVEAGDILITFEVNGGMYDQLPTSIVKVSTDGKKAYSIKKSGQTNNIVFPVPFMNGNVFDGWYTAQEGGERLTDITGITVNTILYAHYVEGVTFTFVLNDGQLSSLPEGARLTDNGRRMLYVIKKNEPYSFPNRDFFIPERKGYIFTGWYSSNSGGTRLTDNKSLYSSNITLYAIWQKVSTRGILSNPVINNNITTWDCVYFGNYWQNDTNLDNKADKSDSKQSIKWRVLDVTDEDIYLLADQVLYEYTSKDTSDRLIWKNSDIRSFLNGYGPAENILNTDYSGKGIIDELFSTDERNVLLSITITENGHTYDDLIKCLSPEEAGNASYGFLDQYKMDNARYAEYTYYCKENNWYESDKNNLGSSWILGEYDNYYYDNLMQYNNKSYIYYVGQYGIHSSVENSTMKYGIRPVIKISKSSSLWTYAGTVSSKTNSMTKLFVYFDGNGGNIEYKYKEYALAESGKDYQKVYGSLPEPKREKYRFTGWYTEREGGLKVLNNSKIISTTEHTLYAHWEPDINCVYFDMNDGNGSFFMKNVISGEAYGRLPDVSREGFIFAGWYTQAEGGSRITEGSIFAGPDSITLYAHWIEPIDIIFTFDANGGKCDVATKVYRLGSKYGELPGASNGELVFDGWFTEKEGGNNITVNNTVEYAEEYILYAHWSEKPKPVMLVTFDTCGGASSVTSKTVVMDSAYGELPMAEKEGYIFAGWFTEEKEGNIVTADTVVTEESDHILYAHWNKTNIVVVFDGNGGLVNLSSKTVTENEEYGELPVPERDDYVFNGWYTEREEGQEVKEDTVVKNSETHTLYARWIRGSITVYLDGCDGEIDTTEIHVFEGEKYGKLPDYSGRKQLFLGWYTSKYDGELVTSDTIVKEKNSHTLYAHWEYITIATKQKLKVSSYFENGSKYERFIVNNIEGKAKINKKGILTAKKPGKVLIFPAVKFGKKYIPDSTVKPMTLIITKPAAEKKISATYIGQSISANSLLRNLPANSNHVEWEVTGNPGVAVYNEVTECFDITGVGNTMLTAYIINEQGYRTKVKTKLKVRIPEFTTETEMMLEVSQVQKTSLRYVPKGKTVEWRSSDESIVYVRPKGKSGGRKAKIVGVNAGKATVTAIVDGQEYKLNVTVY